MAPGKGDHPHAGQAGLAGDTGRDGRGGPVAQAGLPGHERQPGAIGAAGHTGQPGPEGHIAAAESIGPAGHAAVFRPAPVPGTEATLGVLLALTLMAGVGLPLILFVATGAFSWWLLAVVLVISVAPFALVRAAVRSLRYEVGAAGVSVHHLRRKSYPWDEIEAVRVLRRPLRGFVRIGMGSTTAGFHVGPFRESRLGRIQAYVTAVTPPLVVLETRSDPVLLSPDDVDGFVAAVRRFSGRPGIVVDRPEQEERGADGP